MRSVLQFRYHSENKNPAVAEMGDRFATIDMARKVGASVLLYVGGARSLSNVMSHGPMSTSAPSGFLIHPTVWSQYTNVTDRQDNGPVVWGERLLVTVAQFQTMHDFIGLCIKYVNRRATHL